MFTTVDKFLVSAIGMVLLVLNSVAGSAAFSPNVQNGISLAVAVLTPISVYLVRNKPA